MRQNRFISFFVALTFLFIGINQSFAQQSDAQSIREALHQSIKNWEENRYILFTAQGNTSSALFNGSRTFLIDKNSGDCRLETTSSSNKPVVVLFNFKSKKLSKAFENNKQLASSTNQLSPILDQFYEDTKLLFLPVFLSETSIKLEDIQSKLMDSEKVNIITFSNLNTFDNTSSSGRFILDAKGEIKLFEDGTTTFSVSNSKDIGSGILLPTNFQNKKDAQSCVFNTVAAFTNIENGKFTSL